MAWSNRIKAIVLGLGFALTYYSSANWWSIFAHHAPACAPTCTSDFVTFYAEAKLLREDMSALYDLNRQFAYQQQISPTTAVLPFVYPPLMAGIIAGLGWLDFSAAFVAVTLLNIALIGLSVKKLTDHFHLTTDQWHWLSLFACCNIGVHQLIYQGQTSALILYVTTQCVIAEHRFQHGQAGFWTGLASFKPQYLPLLHLSLLAGSKWRAFFVALLVSTILISISFIAIGMEASQQYFALTGRMMSDNSDWWNPLMAMHNLRALTAYWVPTEWRLIVWLAGTFFVIASMVFCNLRMNDRSSFTGIWLVNILGLLVTLPHLFTHDLSLLILPCALFLDQFKEPVPISIGLGLIVLAALPIMNYVLPTIVAITLFILYVLSVVLVTYGCNFGRREALDQASMGSVRS